MKTRRVSWKRRQPRPFHANEKVSSVRLGWKALLPLCHFFSWARGSSCLCFNLSLPPALRRNRNAWIVHYPLQTENKLVEAESQMDFKKVFHIDSFPSWLNAHKCSLCSSPCKSSYWVYRFIFTCMQIPIVLKKTSLQIARTISSWEFKIKLSSWAVFQMISKVPVLTQKPP